MRIATPYLDRLHAALVDPEQRINRRLPMTVSSFFKSIHPWSIPEDRINPPEREDEPFEVRNSLRIDIIQAIGTIDDRLNELEPIGQKNILNDLKELREYLERDMETGED